MPPRLRRLAPAAALLVAILAACSSAPPVAEVAVSDLAPSGDTVEATVTKVTDGDTIHVEIDGIDYTVRYIGVDTPETVDPNQEVQPFGPEASQYNEQLVGGRTVHLEKDVSETDQYGRLLRYVWLFDEGTESWIFVNAALLRMGYAQVSTYPPDVNYVDDVFLPAQDAAQAAGVGLWASDAPATPAPSATLSATPTAEPTPPPDEFSGGSCDPSYTNDCIPPAPPDLNCNSPGVGQNIMVDHSLPDADPHDLDDDGDGIACEAT